MNIMKLGMQFLGPIVVKKIAGSLGIESPMVQKAIAAALPTILAALVGRSASSEGASSIFGLLQNAPDTSADDYEAALGGQIGDMASGGNELLGNLLGGSQQNAIAGALSKFAGADSNTTGMLMGLLAPAVTGLLKGQVKEQGLDAGGLASMLAGQKANIAAEMPAGMVENLAGSGVLGAIEGELASLTAPVQDAAPTMPKVAPEPPKSGGGLMKILLPLVVLAGLAWYFLGGSAPDVAEMAGGEITVGDVNLTEQFGGITSSLTETLSGVTDAASAEAAVPALEGIQGQIGALEGLVGQLGDEGKGAFGGIVSTALATLQPIIENVLGVAGSDSPIAPILNQIVEALTGLAG